MNLEPQHTAFIFPGQGSQAVGMGRELAEAFPAARHIFDRADAILDFPLTRLAWEGPEAELNDTLNTQPALLAHSAAVLYAFQEKYPGFSPAFVAGHSMGELSALVGSQALPAPEALKLARRRGQLMKKSGEVSPGGMAAILGLDLPAMEKVCAEASREGQIVQVANDNCPGQVVISGAREALERAMALAQAAGARKVTPLAVSIAAHSPLMAGAQQEFNRAVAAAPIQDARIPLVGNVTASPLSQAGQIRADLQAQLTHRVRWAESVQFMIAQGVNTFIEMGTGSVLTGLLKRIDRSVVGYALGKPEDFDKLEG